MLPRWSRALTQLSRLGSTQRSSSLNHRHALYAISRQGHRRRSGLDRLPAEPVVKLDKLFWSKPCSLALPADSPMRIDEPEYKSIKRVLFTMMLFYSKQSKSTRGANVVCTRVVSQVDKPAIYEVFNLEKTFKTTYALLVLHMWLCLRRLKQDGKEGGDHKLAKITTTTRLCSTLWVGAMAKRARRGTSGSSSSC